MTGKRRTPLPRPSTRKRKPGQKPAPPRPKGEIERLAVRRRDAMKYRMAGVSYRAIAEKLTDEERAQAYADEHGVSFERAMKKITHVSVRTVWDDVTAEYEELRRETEVNRADSMALQNARLDQVFSKALSLFANGSVPAGRLAIATMGRRCLFVAGSLPVRVPPRAGVEVRGERFVRGAARALSLHFPPIQRVAVRRVHRPDERPSRTPDLRPHPGFLVLSWDRALTVAQTQDRHPRICRLLASSDTEIGCTRSGLQTRPGNTPPLRAAPSRPMFASSRHGRPRARRR